MNSKLFAQRFNRELALLGFPEDLNEKIKAITKVFSVNRHIANGLIFGHFLPQADLLENIAAELEVCADWLSGATDKKRAYVARELEEMA